MHKAHLKQPNLTKVLYVVKITEKQIKNRKIHIDDNKRNIKGKTEQLVTSKTLKFRLKTHFYKCIIYTVTF